MLMRKGNRHIENNDDDDLYIMLMWRLFVCLSRFVIILEPTWNPPGTMKNHENQPGTMKNHPGTIKSHENPPGTKNLLC